MRIRLLAAAVCVAAFGVAASAQTPASPAPQPQEQSAAPAPGANPIETVANEISLLRKSVLTLSTRLREVGEKFSAPGAKAGAAPLDKQHPIARSLELLSQAEQRAEVMRKLLLEMTEKETAYRTRLVQIEEDMRPDNVERAVSMVGSTRTPEVREVRRRVLENERRGVETLLTQTFQSRTRVEDDLRQAEVLVTRLRLRVLPLIEKEIEKINPNQE